LIHVEHFSGSPAIAVLDVISVILGFARQSQTVDRLES
jgi:hypothetical protein